jgi:hypothetical protein
MKRAAKELAVLTAQLSKHLASKAEIAAKDPKGSAKKAVQRVAKELDKAAKDIEKVLRDI